MEEALKSKKNCTKVRFGDALNVINTIIECHDLNRALCNKPKLLFRILQAMYTLQGERVVIAMSSIDDICEQVAVESAKLYRKSWIKNGLILLKYRYGLVLCDDPLFGIDRTGVQIVKTLRLESLGNKGLRKFVRPSNSPNVYSTSESAVTYTDS